MPCQHGRWGTASRRPKSRAERSEDEARKAPLCRAIGCVDKPYTAELTRHRRAIFNSR